jgi:DNA mismatch repair ATPase MutL
MPVRRIGMDKAKQMMELKRMIQAYVLIHTDIDLQLTIDEQSWHFPSVSWVI